MATVKAIAAADERIFKPEMKNHYILLNNSVLLNMQVLNASQ